MKINRWIALAAIALLVVAAMGFVSFRAFAWLNPSPAAQDCAGDTESGEANEAAEDSDAEECDQQGQAEDQDGSEAESQDNGAALQGQAAITQAEAEAIALAESPGAKVVATELENEGGTLLYSVELDNGAEVEVDANTGAVLPAEAESGG